MKKIINKVLLLLVIINLITSILPDSKIWAGPADGWESNPGWEYLWSGYGINVDPGDEIYVFSKISYTSSISTLTFDFGERNNSIPITAEDLGYEYRTVVRTTLLNEGSSVPIYKYVRTEPFKFDKDFNLQQPSFRWESPKVRVITSPTRSNYVRMEGKIQKRKITNNAPTTPSNITVPTTIKSGENIPISWAASIDSDGDSITYRLERSINGGSYTQIYSGSSRNYTDKAQSSWETVAYRVRAYDGTDYSSYRTSSIVTIINNEKPSITVIEPLTNKRVGNQDNLIISGNVRDADIGDILKIKYNLSNTKNREITLTQPKNIISNGQNQSFQGYINLGGLSSGNEVLEIYAEDNKGGTSNKINIPINVFNSLESILKSLKSYTKSGQPQILVVNTDTIIIQSTNNDNLINQIKKELKNKNVKLYFIGKDGPTRAFLESKLLK